MKYYSELSKIEDSIIRLECIESLVRVIASGVPSTNLEDASNALWHLTGSIEDTHAKLRSDFDDLWDMIREEDVEPEKEKNQKSRK